MNKFIVLFCGIAATGIADSGPLNLEQALELARTNSPGLRAAHIYSQAAEKGVDAAGRWTNPRLKFESEGLGWDNDLFSEGEYTLELQQNFQRGGKRQKEQAVAHRSVGIANQAALEMEWALAAQVRQAFVEVMAQQETGKVRDEQEQLGRAFVKVAQRRHAMGGGSELDVVQAELALEEILLSKTCCFGDLLATQETLAALIGIPVKTLPELTAAYYELETLGELTVDDSLPSLRRIDAEVEKVRAEAVRAQAQDASDLLLGAGVRYEAADEIHSFVFSASMPLNFNKRGRAAYAAGMLRADAVLADRAELRRKLQEELATRRALYEGAKVEAEMTQNKLMPKAEQAYELSRAGYDLGRFSWLELIAAQQHLTEIRIRYIEALRDAHLARAQISKFMKEGV